MAKTSVLASSSHKKGHSNAKRQKRSIKKCKAKNISKAWSKALVELKQHELKFMQHQKAYASWLESYKMPIPQEYNSEDWQAMHFQIRPEIRRSLQLALQNHQQFSFQLIQESQFEKDTNGETVQCQHFFQHRMQNVLSACEIDEAISQQLAHLDKRIQDFVNNGSGWRHIRVISFVINVARYRALGGGTYVKLPPYLANKKAIINVQNKDDQCFKWSVLAAVFPTTTNPQRVSKYMPFEDKLNFKDVQFPATASDITTFEKHNSYAIFVYHLADDDKSIQPLRISKKRVPDEKRIRLFYHKGHYMWIKDISRLLHDQTHYQHRTHFCDYCCSSFASEANRNAHEERCSQFDMGQLVKMPIEGQNLLRFKNYAKKLKAPYIVYADFEALNISNDGSLPSCSKKTQYLTHHEPSSFTYIIIRSDGESFEPRRYRGENAAAKFIERLEEDLAEIDKALQDIQPMQMTAQDVRAYNAAKKCHICERPFDFTRQNKKCPEKVRDHDHITGQFRGAAHGICNLNFRFSPKVPVVLHNLGGYDSHIIIQGAEREHEIEVIAHNLEKYM